MTKRILQLEDSPKWVQNVKGAIAGESGIELMSAVNKHEFYIAPFNTADLYIIDRHFPDNKGDLPKDNWESVVSYLAQDSPQTPVIILSDEPPSRKECSHYKNVREVLNKGQFSDAEFRLTIKHQLGMH